MRKNLSSPRFVRYYGNLPCSNYSLDTKDVGHLKQFLHRNPSSIYSLILFNIDNFCRINNAYGFEVGDEVISSVLEIIQSAAKKCGDIYHIMGDEFALVINTNLNPLDVTHSIIGACIGNPIVVKKTLDIRISLSAGIATGNAKDLLKHSTIALMDARTQGKGKIVIYRPNMQVEQDIENNFIWQNRLKESFENDCFVPFFQPILNTKTNKIEKYECLIRLKDNDHIIEPAMFLGAAKECDMLSSITRTVLSKSFAYFRNNNFDFSVNITEDDLLDENFLAFISHKLNYYNINPKRVYLEILEGIGTNIVCGAIKTLQELKKLGCRLVVDDFGVGYSNFHRMLELDIDIIKIDGSFISTLETSKNSKKIVEAVVGFAKAIDAKVVAEFVKSKEILDIIRQMNIDYAQGYFIGKPSLELL